MSVEQSHVKISSSITPEALLMICLHQISQTINYDQLIGNWLRNVDVEKVKILPSHWKEK